MTSPRTGAGDAGLRAWSDALRRDARRGRQRHRLVLTTGLAALVCVGPSLFRPGPLLVWNASASAPLGLYWISPAATPMSGDLVIALPPAPIRGLAARRGYLPFGVPLVKRIAAVSGDQICALGPHLFLGGEPLVDRRARDAAGHPMPWWTGCVRLGRGQTLLVMADVPTSFDGRYFGPTNAGDILGKAHPLWLR